MRTKRKSTEYNADSIVVLEGLEGIRAKPGMYVGDTDHRGLLHLVKEVVGNSIDEAMSGHGDTIAIDISKDGVVTVFDRGRGIPTGPHKSDPKTDTLTIIATKLHSGGKLKDTAKNYSAGATIGTHGVGLAVVNALTTAMTIWTKSSGKWQEQSFSRGKTAGPVKPSKSVPKFDGKTWPNGTIVQFTPDLKVFAKGSKLRLNDVYDWLKQLSWFVYGPKSKPITYTLNLGGKSTTIRRESLASYGKYTCKAIGAEPLIDKLQPFVYSSQGCDVLFYPTTHDAESIYSAVSAVQTSAGGTHVAAMRKSFTAAIDKLRKRSQKFTLDDLLVGAVVVCNVKMTDAAFAGQSKERLTSDVTAKFNGLEEALVKWFKSNKSAMQTMFDRATELGSLNIAAKLNKKLAAKLKTKKGGKSLLPINLINSTTKNREEREMFIVEGQSAGGSARKASDRGFQEIFLLRGKILNVVKRNDKMTDSKVIVDLLKSIGFDPKADFDKSRRVGRIYLLTDPDPDGSHISCLLLGMLYSVVPKLFDEGRVFDIVAPLYSYSDAKTRAYGMTLKEIRDTVGKSFNPQRLTRMKGWGEASPRELNEIAFDTEKRKVNRITTRKAIESKKVLMAVLGQGTEFRKTLLGLPE